MERFVAPVLLIIVAVLLSIFSPRSSISLRSASTILGIYDQLTRISDDGNTGEYKAKDGAIVTLNPAELISTRGIEEQNDTHAFDNQSLAYMRTCTDEAIRMGGGSFTKELGLRISCLTNKGYNSNDLAYLQIKHGLRIQ